MKYQYTELTNEHDSREYVILEELMLRILINRGISEHWTYSQIAEYGKSFYKLFQAISKPYTESDDLFWIDFRDEYLIGVDDGRGRTDIDYNYPKIFAQFESILTNSRRRRKINQLLMKDTSTNP